MRLDAAAQPWTRRRTSSRPVDKPVQGPLVAGASCIGSTGLHVEGGLGLAVKPKKSAAQSRGLPARRGPAHSGR